MRAPAALATRPARTHRHPALNSTYPAPAAEPPPRQHPRAARADQLPSTQPDLDAININLYREHQAASAQRSRPSRRLRQEKTGRAVPLPGPAHAVVAHEEEQAPGP